MCSILIFSLGLASVSPSDWTLAQGMILAPAYLAFVGILPVFTNMAQASSSNRPTPLQCLFNHFKDFRRRAQDYGASVTPFDLQRFCQLDWAIFGSGWPSERSLDLQTAFQVWGIISGNPGHPDQAPHTDVWIDIFSDAPKYLKDCRCGQESKATPKSVLLSTPKGPKEKPSGHLTLFTLSYRHPLRTLRSLILLLNSSGDLFLSPSNRKAEPLQSPPHTRTGVVYWPPQDPDPVPDLSNQAAVLAPLQQLAPPVGGETQGPFMVYVLFSTSDLYKWKYQNLSFSEKPQGLTSLLETIFFTHQPPWDNCQQLLQVLFTSEEWQRILREAAKAVLEPNGQPSTHPTCVQYVLLNTRPPWDPNTDQVLAGPLSRTAGDPPTGLHHQNNHSASSPATQPCSRRLDLGKEGTACFS
ncbi:uncharacterized protein LOC120619219 isoform X1 [Pteropus medius]|uniref:uncharacterized protein LOC120619219 isoform X1 n=1 Tax=Pteropus vampyrus TaxID=132908 RepID=UPI00196A7D55|nr:uncharacterized protein LOC120619219 isoform X1 [Pteropus giganteus]